MSRNVLSLEVGHEFSLWVGRVGHEYIQQRTVKELAADFSLATGQAMEDSQLRHRLKALRIPHKRGRKARSAGKARVRREWEAAVSRAISVIAVESGVVLPDTVVHDLCTAIEPPQASEDGGSRAPA